MTPIRFLRVRNEIMLDNVKKIWKKSLTKPQMIDYILSVEEHYWIRNDQYIKLNMTEFLERI